jgi:hypothetical protein
LKKSKKCADPGLLAIEHGCVGNCRPNTRHWLRRNGRLEAAIRALAVRSALALVCQALAERLLVRLGLWSSRSRKIAKFRSSVAEVKTNADRRWHKRSFVGRVHLDRSWVAPRCLIAPTGFHQRRVGLQWADTGRSRSKDHRRLEVIRSRS